MNSAEFLLLNSDGHFFYMSRENDFDFWASFNNFPIFVYWRHLSTNRMFVRTLI